MDSQEKRCKVMFCSIANTSQVNLCLQM